jgi:hypothetical protein
MKSDMSGETGRKLRKIGCLQVRINSVPVSEKLEREERLMEKRNQGWSVQVGYFADFGM